MCLQSRRINHTGHSHPPKIEMLEKYIMYLEHSNIIFVQNNNNNERIVTDSKKTINSHYVVIIITIKCY